jgi:two-component system response regulator AlgR
MRVMIVDDEHLARDRLARMVDKVEDVEVVGQAQNGIEAVRLAGDCLPDLVLLDIRMPGMDGLETARHLNELAEPPAIVFCTAYEEHAVEAFDVQAVGYLLKPVRREDLKEALTRARRVNRVQLQALDGEGSRRRTHVSTRTRRGIELVPVNEVRYFQADQKYVTARHATGELIIDETLRELETEFADLFVRIHRNTIVAAQFVAGLDRNPEGHYRVRMHGVEETLDISRRHVAAVRKFIKDL